MGRGGWGTTTATRRRRRRLYEKIYSTFNERACCAAAAALLLLSLLCCCLKLWAQQTERQTDRRRCQTRQRPKWKAAAVQRVICIVTISFSFKYFCCCCAAVDRDRGRSRGTGSGRGRGGSRGIDSRSGRVVSFIEVLVIKIATITKSNERGKGEREGSEQRGK